MLRALRRFFAPPVFPEDEDKTRSAFIVEVMGWCIVFVLIAVLAIQIIHAPGPHSGIINLTLLTIIVITAATLYISRRGYVQTASLIQVTIGWVGLTYIAGTAEGIRDVTFWGYFVSILMAGMLLGWKGAIGFTAASAISGWVLAYAETNGLIVVEFDKPLNFALHMTFIFLVVGALMYLMITSLQNALNRSRAIARDLSSSNKELSKLHADLEQHIAERTTEIEKRASQLEVVSSVARAIASVQDLDTLLPTITQAISQQFGFYHVGIFLLDEKKENAVLRASNSLGGLQMLNRQHSLPIDARSIVGYSISRGEPRIALDVGADAIYFNNPDLPETRSEIALPLRISGRIIGSLDVQSTQLNAFARGDIAVLATLADQVAIAIENARLFGEARDALYEARALFEKYTQQEWSAFAKQVKQTRFIFDGKQVLPLEKTARREAAKTVTQTGGLSLEKETDSIGVPIRLRGQTIGIMDVRSKKGPRQWKQDEISILEAAAERAALALENARLVESAQRRAARERAIGDISTKIGAVSNLDSILQVAVEELGRRIGGATEVALEITSNDDQDDH